jgi:tetratricopeptide (TPR) repeat protein
VDSRKRAAWIGMVGLLAAMVIVADYGAQAWRDQRSVDHAARLLESGQYRSAAQELLRELVLAPHDPLIHYYLGRAYAGLGFPAAARRKFVDAVRLDPQQPAFHAALGHAYRDAGQVAQAITELEEAVRRDPHYRIELVALLLDERRVPEAVEQLRRAVQLDPGAADVHLLLADELARVGDRASTLAEYGEVVRLAHGTALGEVARQRLGLLTSRFLEPSSP